MPNKRAPDGRAPKDEELRQATSPSGQATRDDLYDLCLLKYLRAGVGVDVFNQMRVPLRDCAHADPKKDWLRPFIVAMCVWHEHEFREMLGLPNACGLPPMEAIPFALLHSHFADIVMDGVWDPNLEWERLMREHRQEA